MRLQIDRTRKIVLLKWLRQGFIDTLDLPEAYEGGNLFLELMQEAGRREEMEREAAGNTQNRPKWMPEP